MSSQDDRKLFAKRIENFLRAQHPMKTADYVAADTRCSRAQVLKWLDGSAAPGVVAIARLTQAYGPAFLQALMGERCPGWLDAAQRAQRLAEIEASRNRIEEELRAIVARQ